MESKSILAILPFDHRSYFENLLGSTVDIPEYKKIVYEGYEKSLELGVPKESSAILVDDVFGLDILMDAKEKGYMTLQSTEISGDDHFEFEHSADWQAWIEKVKPTYVKALVRYNPETNKELNQSSLDGLRELSKYAHAQGYKLLIEPLVIPSDEQLTRVSGDKHRYDTETRPKLTAQMIAEMQGAGIEPDIWKIEGMFAMEDYEIVVHAAQAKQDDGTSRNHVGVIALGRNETDEIVETWLKIGSQVPGVIGFAVGRTVFLNALMKFKSGEYTREEAVTEIAERFKHFYDVFLGK